MTRKSISLSQNTKGGAISQNKGECQYVKVKNNNNYDKKNRSLEHLIPMSLSKS